MTEPYAQHKPADDPHSGLLPYSLGEGAITVVRIGLVRYEPDSVRSAGGPVFQECVMCGIGFPLRATCGVAADAEYTFLGNICPTCLLLSLPQLRQTLRWTAARLRSDAIKASADDYSVLAARLLSEAAMRERWAAGKLVTPGTHALTLALEHKIPVEWQPYPLIRTSTALYYDAWFGTAEPKKPS